MDYLQAFFPIPQIIFFGIFAIFYYGICYIFPPLGFFEGYISERRLAKKYFLFELNEISKKSNIKLYSQGFSYNQITHWIVTRTGVNYTLESIYHNVFDKDSRCLMRSAKSELLSKKRDGKIDDFEIFSTRCLPILPTQAVIFR